jgi:hypothetical protein
MHEVTVKYAGCKLRKKQTSPVHEPMRLFADAGYDLKIIALS